MNHRLALISTVLSAFIASTTSQITGTYPIRLVGSGTPDHLDGANRTNYPSCAVSILLISIQLCLLPLIQRSRID